MSEESFLFEFATKYIPFAKFLLSLFTTSIQTVFLSISKGLSTSPAFSLSMMITNFILSSSIFFTKASKPTYSIS